MNVKMLWNLKMNVYLFGCLSIVLFQVSQVKLWLDVPPYQQKQRTSQQACTYSPFPFWGNTTHTMCPESWRADWRWIWLLLRCCILSREIRKSYMSILKYDSESNVNDNYFQICYDSCFRPISLEASIDHFTRCKQHWSRSTSCFSFL